MFLRKTLKVISVFILTLILLFIVIILTMNLAPVRKQLVSLINHHLQKREIPVQVGNLNIFRLKQADLSDILIFDEKKDTILYAGNLDVHFNLSALLHRKITILSFEASDLRLRLIQEDSTEPLNLVKAFSKQESKDKPVQDSGSWSFDIHRIKLGSIDLSYHSLPKKMMLNLTLQGADVELNKSDLKEKELMVRSVSINGVNIETYSGNTAREKPDTSTTSGFPWNIEISNIAILNSSYQSGTYPENYPGKFESQFVLSAFMSELSDITFKSDQQGATIIHTSFSLDNGFLLKDLQGKVNSRENQTNFEFHILTNESKLNISGQSDTLLLAMDGKNNNSVLSIRDTRIDPSDLLYFKPGLTNAPWFKEYGTNPVSVYASIFQNQAITGIDSFALYQSKNRWLSLKGRISDILEPELTKKADLKISSSNGNVTLDGNINLAQEWIHATILMNRIRPGEISKQDVVQEINGSVMANVSGFSSGRMLSDFNMNLHSIKIKDHTYDHVKIHGKITPKEYSVSTIVTDTAVTLDLATHLVRKNNAQSIVTDGSFMFTPALMGFGEDTVTVEALISGSLKQSFDTMKATLDLSEILLKKAGAESRISFLRMNMKSDSLNTTLNSSSDFMDIDFAMEGPVKNTGALVKDLKGYFTALARNYTLDSAFHSFNIPVASLKANFRYHPSLNILSNDTSLRFSDATISVSSNEQTGQFLSHVRLSGIHKDNLSVGGFETSIKDSAGTVNLSAKADSIAVSSQFLESIDFSHEAVNSENSGHTLLSVKNDRDKVNIQIEMISQLRDSVLTVTVPSSQVILNGITWKTSQPELFQYNRFKGEFLPQVTLSTDSSMLMFATIKDNAESGFNVEFDRVNLSSLVPAALLPDSISAIINGAVQYRTGVDNDRRIEADMDITRVAWSDMRLNQLGIKGTYNSTGADTFTIVSDIKLDSAGLHLEGSSTSAQDRELNFLLSDFPLHIFKPIVQESLSELSGYVSGDINFTSGEKQRLDGDINLEDIRVRIAAINALFRIPEDNITLTGNRINFDRFVVLDSLDNELFVNGSIDFANRNNINTNIDISTPQMLVMSSAREDNESFYGTILAGTQMSVRGPLKSPKVQGTLSVNKGTEIYYANQPSYAIQDMTETVTFINPAGEITGTEEDIVQQRSTIGANVNIDPQAIIHFSLQDQLYDIKLDIQGGGALNYTVFSNNQSNLSGVYEISEGNADLKIRGFSEKQFSILEGSFIRWIDRVEDPEMQIEAQNTVTGKYKNPTDQADRIVDFNVVLRLTNRLSALNVLMTVSTEDQYLMSIINTMSPEEQMKQAVSLLLFQTINIPGIYTTSNQINDQVNQIVESQLNKLTQASIKDFDISLGVDSYTTPTGGGAEETQTSLSYGIKKDILNDRASVEISGRLNNNQQGGNDYSASNFTFEYRLDSAATKYIKVYRQRSYEDILEGEVERTGFGIIFRKTFESIKGIWKGNKKKKSGK